MSPELPPDESQRIKALRSYDILDTDAEKEFDDLTLLASHICETPIAMISLVDEKRQWFKSKIGMPMDETPRDVSFCAHGILESEVMIVKDTHADKRFAANPLVTGNPKIRFYAGAPLKASDGHAIGMICVSDRVPRELSAAQVNALQALSRLVVVQLELRSSSRQLKQTVARLEKTRQELQARTAFFEALANTSHDGVLVVDGQGRKIFQNEQMRELWKIPQEIVDDPDDSRQVNWVANATKDPEEFLQRVRYLYSHRDEISKEVISLKDGTILERYTSPVVDPDGKHHGRIWSFHDITESRRQLESLALLGSAVEQAKESILITDAELDSPGPRIVFVNPAFTHMTGYSPDEVLGKTPRILQGANSNRSVLDRLRQNLERGEIFEGEAINYRKDGEEFQMEWQIAPIRNAGDQITHYVAVQRDITVRKRIEARLFQSQKMETVGKLAGGIAHEFNSILTAIIGYSEFLVASVPEEEAIYKSAQEIHIAANRAALLTAQLLAYGRKQMLQPKTLDLNVLVADSMSTVKQLMGREVDVRISSQPGPKMVRIDPGQLEQVIVNLAMNAADAMPNGGRLTFETASAILDETYVSAFAGLKAGPYVKLAVTDTGVGMSPEVKARAFEPFFSTKKVGEGTGLGLAACHGLIKQSEGHVSLYSEPARGTTVTVYLPQIESPSAPSPAPVKSFKMPVGNETILVAEDDPSLLEMISSLLKRQGYTVLTAANGIDALNLKQRPNVGHIDLLLTDVVMPHMSGKELSDRIRTIYPRTKILFTSAYAENAILHHGILDEGVTLLQKPFTPSALANKVREVLDQPS